MARFSQRPLFCRTCGGPTPLLNGLCPRCYRQRRRSLRYFSGLREAVLARDGLCCQGCGAGKSGAVHHRRPGVNACDWLVTVCPACHAVIHKLRRPRRWLPGVLLALWRELHPELPLQLQFALDPAGRASGEAEGREAA